jgi:hypothetical protein
MLESIRGLNGWHWKDYRTIYKLWWRRIMKQDESNGDPKFTVIITFGGKSLSHWKNKQKTILKMDKNIQEL